MTNDNGVTDPIRLLKTMLAMRECALALAISERDSVLASVVECGIDSEIHRILANYTTSAEEKAAAARTEASTKLGTGFQSGCLVMATSLDDLDSKLQMTADVARKEAWAEDLSLLSKLAGDTVERAKGLHPMLFERTTVELIDLLKEHEDKQREQKEAEANTATTSS